MAAFRIRVLVVDDFEPFRKCLSTALQKQPQLQIICEVGDGLEAVQKAGELQPDLILLDIGLPTVNGIEVARRIREVSPKSKMLFISQESSPDMVQEAFSSGATGYVVKTEAGSELLTAVTAVLRGERFVGRRFAGHDFTHCPDSHTADSRSDALAPPTAVQPEKSGRTGRHEVLLYSDETQLLNKLVQFIGTTLKAGNAAIVVATESHRNSLLASLQAYGLDLGASIGQGRYIAVDAADTISTFLVNDMLDAGRFLEAIRNLIQQAAKSAKGERPRVSIFGEGTHILWIKGNEEAAIADEKLCNQLCKMYDVDILCGYFLGSIGVRMDDQIFQQICAEHSAVYSQ